MRQYVLIVDKEQMCVIMDVVILAENLRLVFYII